MSKLHTTAALVKSILEKDEKTRNSDSLLYLKVLKTYGEKIGVDVCKMPVSEFLLKSNEYGLPPFETVRRTRQKVQADYPNLRGNAVVEALRAEQMKEYRAYALERKQGE